MSKKNIFSTIALIVIGVVFGAILVSSADLVKLSKAESIQIGSTSSPVTNLNLTDFNNAFVQVAEKVTPSIVRIIVVSSVSDPHKGFDFDFPFPFKDMIPKNQQGGGSGVIISPDGYIVTNNHVVENATSITVHLFDKRKFDAELVGRDPQTDLAVIKIDVKDLPAAYLGNSDNVRVGSWVMAIGNPLNYLTSTVTAGIVSAIGRSINIIRDSEGYGIESFIQTDAAINPGNSGGALVDLTGAVIGINSAIATNGFSASYIGYGFAIPINIAKTVAEDLIQNGEVIRGYIGVKITEVDAATAKAVGLDKPTGIMIQEIVKDGSASEKDIQPGDIILEIDGNEVNQPNELQSYVATKRAGTEVELTIFRDGEKIKRSVVLKPRDSKSTAKPVSTKSNDSQKDSKKEIKEIEFTDLGFTVKDLSREALEKYKAENGILITNVENFSKAANQNLAPGALIIEANKKPVKSVVEFEEIINSKKGEAVLLRVQDQSGNSFFIGLEIPEK